MQVFIINPATEYQLLPLSKGLRSCSYGCCYKQFGDHPGGANWVVGGRFYCKTHVPLSRRQQKFYTAVSVLMRLCIWFTSRRRR